MRWSIYRHEEYVQEGGKFVVVVLDMIARLFLGLDVTLAVVGVIAAVVAGGVCLVRSRMLGVDARTYLGGWRSRYDVFVARWRLHVRVALFVGCALLFFYSPVEQLSSYREPLQLTGLLYEKPGATAREATSQSAQLVAAIRGHETARLVDHFGATLLPYALLSAALLLVAWHLSVGWKARAVLVAPFVIVTSTYVLLLPMVYGVLIRTNRLPRIIIHAAGAGDEKLYLLEKVDEAFVVWNPAAGTIAWLPTREVSGAELREDDVIVR